MHTNMHTHTRLTRALKAVFPHGICLSRESYMQPVRDGSAKLAGDDQADSSESFTLSAASQALREIEAELERLDQGGVPADDPSRAKLRQKLAATRERWAELVLADQRERRNDKPEERRARRQRIGSDPNRISPDAPKTPLLASFGGDSGQTFVDSCRRAAAGSAS